MEYNFRELEKVWQKKWADSGVYKVSNDSIRPKYYILDMFPYPSGAGLHVGHPLGYISSDILSRYKRLKGFNVLHPMGYDSFGLPAEQYALETGQHPLITTENNIHTFRSQLDNIGFSYDWTREVKTSDVNYYKWTQWIFIQIFNSWYDCTWKKARPIADLVKIFETEGNVNLTDSKYPGFNSIEWNDFENPKKQEILMSYRQAYLAYGEVNWCETLGTVLANDEVINGVSERGGHTVVKKKMRQWYLRITDYADRLLEGLNHVDFSDAMKEMQRNWIGKSEGCNIIFETTSTNSHVSSPAHLEVYTTRPDTIFGVDFMVVAPEHDIINQITTTGCATSVENYLAYVKTRSDRERVAEVKQVTGCFTGGYVVNPFNGRQIPVWISEYVLAGYGTGAIMGVPCGDQRDFNFASHFNIPITNIIGDDFKGSEANPTKHAILQNSGFLNGLRMIDAMEIVSAEVEKRRIGKKKINYKMRDAGFSRQRYWGEPFPIIYKDGVAYPLDESELPLQLPHVDSYSPGANGEGPLSNLHDWVNLSPGITRETNTMPGYAGSSWYFLRYADPNNKKEFASKKATDYWNQVDVYVGGTEHAVGHLLYSRMWTKILFDLELISFDEPFKKLMNQGMIQGSSRFVYRVKSTNTFVSHGLHENYQTSKLHVDINFVDGFELDTEAFKKWKPDYALAEFILEDGRYLCGIETEKMSKGKFNTVNPNIIIDKYGADTFRMYEMFLGPVDQSKPWDTKGIEGVHRFLKKLWRLFFAELKGKVWTEEKPLPAEFKILHKTIKKIEEDTERFSYNTAVSAFMVCVNELTDIKSHKKEILQPLLILLAPYAPHISEELWHQLGNTSTILDATFPVYNPSYLVESVKDYPVSVNGKLRTTIQIQLDASQEEVDKLILANGVVQKWLEGKAPKKIIFVKGKMINLVV